MHVLLWEEAYEVLDYESKFLQIKTSLFIRFGWIVWLQVSKTIYSCE